ncbi:hypothetical protein AYL99_11694 [Fonsecaea erecta]|uniref:Uncharacterized protein n=1 Tax=Fonsecaea erecta TaxID=1367422 RepID=A0A178Z2Y0_9EURO|nr:hypothetical protein AYL99_11694 [Fonsecaea erecta]OAP54159.1 hypothetical protein AYL99_11694 [Fonsecaea erecta]
MPSATAPRPSLLRSGKDTSTPEIDAGKSLKSTMFVRLYPTHVTLAVSPEPEMRDDAKDPIDLEPAPAAPSAGALVRSGVRCALAQLGPPTTVVPPWFDLGYGVPRPSWILQRPSRRPGSIWGMVLVRSGVRPWFDLGYGVPWPSWVLQRPSRRPGSIWGMVLVRSGVRCALAQLGPPTTVVPPWFDLGYGVPRLASALNDGRGCWDRFISLKLMAGMRKGEDALGLLRQQLQPQSQQPLGLAIRQQQQQHLPQQHQHHHHPASVGARLAMAAKAARRIQAPDSHPESTCGRSNTAFQQ